MNQTIKKINQERVLFFDIEDVRRSEELDINSREFNLFQKKTRNKDTDELLPDNEVVEEYKKRAALKMCYTKIITIGVGFIKDGEVHIKSIEGSEEEVIKQFCTIAQSFDYVAGSNIIAFDIPMLINNGYRYFDVCEILPDRFVTSGKKPWNLDRIIDLQEVFKGTHYSSSSLDEMCYHFNLPSPKADIDGSEVSEVYYSEGVERISKYVKQDVFACVNLFKKMRFEMPFVNFLDKNEAKQIESFVEDSPLLIKLYNTKQFNDEVKTDLSGKKILKKDKPTVEKLVLAAYLEQIGVMDTNKKELNQINEQRTKEVKEFFKTL